MEYNLDDDMQFQEYLKQAAAAVAHERFESSVSSHTKDYESVTLHTARANMIQKGIEGSLKHAHKKFEDFVEHYGVLGLQCSDALEFLTAVTNTSGRFEELAHDTSRLTKQLVDNYRLVQLEGRPKHTEKRLGLPQVETADYSKR